MDTGITLNPERRAAMVEIGAWNDKLITDYLDQAVASTPDREAIVGYQVTGDTRTALTYRELNDKVTRMAAGLAAMGIGKGEVVACQLSNWWQTTALHLACMRIGAITMTCPEDPAERASQSDGKALPRMEVKVTDFQGNELPAGEEGSLLVRGSSLFIGYLKRPELYGVDEDGWFNTGDLARMDKDGYIRITGRTKDVVIRGGENIPVVEVENLLYKYPGIVDVALVGCPDERLGERLCAYVTLDENATDLTLDQIKAYLTEQQLSKNYLPEYLEVIEAMPRTASGKIQKFKLREQAKEVRLEPAKRG